MSIITKEDGINLAQMSASDLSMSHRRIWAIAGPAIIAGSSTPLVGLVDTWAIGHLPSATHLAAIALGSTIFTYIFWAFGFLRMGTTGLIAQAKGRADHDGNKDGIARVTLRATLLAVVISCCLLLFQNQLYSASIAVLAPPAGVIATADPYFYIRIWASPVTLSIYVINGYLIGTAQAKTVLWLTLILNLANAVLNMVFVIGYDMGVAGVALGTLIAESLTALIGGIFIIRQLTLPRLITALSHKKTWQMSKLKELFTLNGALFIRTLLLITALALITKRAGAIGEVPMAASHILTTFLMLISLGLDGFAYAAEALAGAAYGAKDRTAFRHWVKAGFIWAGVASVAYALAFYQFGYLITELLTDIDPVKAAVRDTGIIIAVLPIVAVWCYQFDGIYIGATASKAMVGTMMVSFMGYLVVLNPLTAAYGLNGIWWAIVIFMGLRGLTQALYYPYIERKLR